MTKILQKLRLPKQQRVILDFINNNPHAVNYDFSENGRFAWHTVSITNKQFALSATLQESKDRRTLFPTDVISYNFECVGYQNCTVADCFLKNQSGKIKDELAHWEDEQRAKFAYRVFHKMLDNYTKERNKPFMPCNVR